MTEQALRLKCRNCNEALEINAVYCHSCGEKLSSGCIACHATLPENAKFCPECGISVDGKMPMMRTVKFRSVLSGQSFMIDININEAFSSILRRICYEPDLCAKIAIRSDDLELLRENGIDFERSKVAIYTNDGTRHPIKFLCKPLSGQLPDDIISLPRFELIYALSAICR